MTFFEFVPEGTKNCRVRAWLHTNNGSTEIIQRQYPAVIICPGGGYGGVSAREAEPVAERYFANGFNTFIGGLFLLRIIETLINLKINAFL